MNLLILGAGGHGVNCLEIARSMQCFDKIAFLDDSQAGGEVCACSILGRLDEIGTFRQEFDCAFAALGNNAMRLDILSRLEREGFQLPILQSPRALVSSCATIDEGSVVFPFTTVEPRASVGKGAILSAHVTVNHDSVIADGTLIYSGSVIRPYAHVGSQVTVGSGCIVSQSAVVADGSKLVDGTVLVEQSK